MGLYVIQRGGAALMVLASAISLPLSQIVFCLPFLLGCLTEKFLYTDAAALVLCLGGFVVYQKFSREGILARGGGSGDE